MLSAVVGTWLLGQMIQYSEGLTLLYCMRDFLIHVVLQSNLVERLGA